MSSVVRVPCTGPIAHDLDVYCDYCIPFGLTPKEEQRRAELLRTRPGMVIHGAGQRDEATGHPLHHDGMLVGEAGGRTEHSTGRPFSGKTGGVANTYIRAAGLSRTELFITNVYPYWTGEGNPDPTAEQIAEAEHILRADMVWVNPQVIGSVGRIATRWFLGDVDLATTHGQPYWSDKAPGVVIVPIHHPAGGFYEPELAKLSQDDFMQFAYYLKNPAPRRKVPRIRVVEKRRKVYVGGYCDTEGLEDRPWGLSWSSVGKVAEVVIAKAGRITAVFTGTVTFHNALHDLKIMRALGISTRGLRYHDTMLKAFVLQLEPQGLKSLVFRHLGLKMHDFDGVVRPWFDKVAKAWLEVAAAAEYPKPEPIAVADYAKRKDRLYKPQGVGRRIKNVLTAWTKEKGLPPGTVVANPVHLEQRWAKIGESQWVDQTEDYQAQATAVVGREFPEFSIFHVPRAKAVRYSGTDAAGTALIDPILDRLLAEKGLTGVYEMDRRALPFVDRMQEVGMRVDRRALMEFLIDLEGLREQRRRRVQSIVGDRWFNPGSGDQVARWLYSVRGLPVTTFTDSGRGSTSDGALQMLRGYHAQDEDVAEFLTGIQDYREADKYIGTYALPILGHLVRDKNGDYRLHANFRVTRVVSGRLASHDPNILALPVRTPLGKRFRHCFVARDGWVIIDCDLSQIELRTMAHLCQDRRMREAFENDEDLHAITASLIFKLPLTAIAKDSPQRYVAKTINFAVMYGISAAALLEQLYKANIFDFTLEDCERFIREWFGIYGSVRRFLEKLWDQAVVDGYVRDMWGRICYVPNVRVMDDQMREAAQRLAGNFPVQSGAGGAVKRAEIRLMDWIEAEGAWDEVLPILQMHDEMLLEVPREREAEAKRLLETVMTADQRRFLVPIKAEAGSGRSWGEAKG